MEMERVDNGRAKRNESRETNKYNSIPSGIIEESKKMDDGQREEMHSHDRLHLTGRIADAKSCTCTVAHGMRMVWERTGQNPAHALAMPMQAPRGPTRPTCDLQARLGWTSKGSDREADQVLEWISKTVQEVWNKRYKVELEREDTNKNARESRHWAGVREDASGNRNEEGQDHFPGSEGSWSEGEGEGNEEQEIHEDEDQEDSGGGSEKEGEAAPRSC